MIVRHGAALRRQDSVPILDGPQAQGDILILPIDPPSDVRWTLVPTQGIEVIRNDVTGHHHTLYAGARGGGAIEWAEKVAGVTLGYLKVPAGQSALLVHSEEHTPSGIAPGFYALHRKRQATVEPYHQPESLDRGVRTSGRTFGYLDD